MNVKSVNTVTSWNQNNIAKNKLQQLQKIGTKALHKNLKKNQYHFYVLDTIAFIKIVHPDKL